MKMILESARTSVVQFNIKIIKIRIEYKKNLDHVQSKKYPLLLPSATLLMILKKQLEQLHPGVTQMDQQSLVKQIAKNKIIYNLSKKQNALQLVYSYIALAEFYVMNQLYEPAVKILNQSQDVRQTGDAMYLLGVCYYKGGKKNEAYKVFNLCLDKQWIQPSVSHQQANQLECVSYMQRIQYERIDKNPQRKDQVQQKMIELCYQKMKIIKKYNTNRSENYYYSLAMGDLAEIYTRFDQYQHASQKIKTAIKLMKGQSFGKQKLIQFYLSSATILQKLNQKAQQLTDLKDAIELVEQVRKHDKKFNKIYEDIYYLYIKKSLGV